MTIGDKIRYFRMKRGFTQGFLAEVTGIHPVSIRKYETNKMVPQQGLIDKIADALLVSSFALTGNYGNIKATTTGDFMGLFFLLYKSNIIQIKGERQEDNSLKPETVTFEINPAIASVLNANFDKNNIEANKINYNITSLQIFSDILKWENLAYSLNLLIEKYGESNDEAHMNALEELKSQNELVEMELMALTDLLN